MLTTNNGVENEIRQTNEYHNTQLIIENLCESVADFARRIDRSPSHVAAYVSPKPRKRIGNIMRKRIEKSFSLPSNWLSEKRQDAYFKKISFSKEDPPKRPMKYLQDASFTQEEVGLLTVEESIEMLEKAEHIARSVVTNGLVPLAQALEINPFDKDVYSGVMRVLSKLEETGVDKGLSTSFIKPIFDKNLSVEIRQEIEQSLEDMRQEDESRGDFVLLDHGDEDDISDEEYDMGKPEDGDSQKSKFQILAEAAGGFDFALSFQGKLVLIDIIDRASNPLFYITGRPQARANMAITNNFFFFDDRPQVRMRNEGVMRRLDRVIEKVGGDFTEVVYRRMFVMRETKEPYRARSFCIDPTASHKNHIKIASILDAACKELEPYRRSHGEIARNLLVIPDEKKWDWLCERMSQINGVTSDISSIFDD